MALLLALLFVSGAAGLVYEVAWTRRLLLLLGSTSITSAVVLAAFLGGLGIGGAFGGRLDILFNNAGVFHPHNAIDCTEEEWDATVDSSLKGAWLMAKYSLPAMIAQLIAPIEMPATQVGCTPISFSFWYTPAW